MLVKKKPRKSYFFATLVVLLLAIYTFFISYSMAKNLIEEPDILRYSRGGVDGIGILLSILFIIITIGNGYCFIKNRTIPDRINLKVSKFITYYAGFIITVMPISGYILTHTIKGNGYIKCESRPYSITYAKTEQACKQYKIRHYPYRKYEDQ